MDEYDPYYFAINYGENESPPRPFAQRLTDVKSAPPPSMPIYLEPVKQILSEPAPVEPQRAPSPEVVAAEPEPEPVEESVAESEIDVQDAVFPEPPSEIEVAPLRSIPSLPSLNNVPALSTCQSTAPSTAGSIPDTSFDYFSQSFESKHEINASPAPTTATAAPKRRGFMRPQGTDFAASARNRDSVMALGTIGHLQYYFARTGLLDGRGGQLARAKRNPAGLNLELPEGSQPVSRSTSMGSYDAQTPDGLSSIASPTYATSDTDFVQSPSEHEQSSHAALSKPHDPNMLPPTVSTYRQRTMAAVPAADITKLRRELTEALEDALKVLKEAENCTDDTPGFHELRGLHLLDISTLAIRAAKAYYTAHPRPAALYALKTDRQLRTELFDVLEILQRMAARNFAGGIRANEKVGLLNWITGISEMLQKEVESEKQEETRRNEWIWRGADETWVGREKQREWSFVRSFVDEPENLPAWEQTTSENALSVSPFLKYLATGLPLVKLHNTYVSRSSRTFEAITTFHTDLAKPYRCAENLRYWVKAAERRWDVRLELDATALVRVKDKAIPTEDDMKVWAQFDTAVMKWCTAVRKELEREWDETAAL